MTSSGDPRPAIEALNGMLSPCRICPRHCGADRLSGAVGYCRAGRLARVSSYQQHFGEEPFLVGRCGSGTIFFARCNLGCVFCQNYDISHHGAGRDTGTAALALMMMDLQALGCHNINLVSPTPWVPQIVEALVEARHAGLSLPVVYNSGGYDSVETLRRLEGYIDIYMPDLKYADNETGRRWSGVPDYWDAVRPALKEMHRQVGDLDIRTGIARRGLLVRHLVMPGQSEACRRCFEFLAREVSARTIVNVMDQYHPAGAAGEYPELDRRLTAAEYRRALANLAAAGLPRYPGL